MATLASLDRQNSPRRRKSCLRKCERYCCNVLQYFPLVFVYGLTIWAVWVDVKIGFLASWGWPVFGRALALLGIGLYVLLNWSYTTAVFTDPGSTVDTRPGYSTLPTSEPRPYTSFTVKSTGDIRFCKKCQAKKPDRAHHCSTCRRCVLKMDHHCPWLATCVGLRNYKPFLLFLVYTSLFCWVCFTASGIWIWKEIIVSGSVEESLMPVNYILLAVLSGIIGLVVSGFTGWHIYLTCKGTTTIESLEKTRYLSPLRQQMSAHLQAERTYVNSERQTITEQLRDIGNTLTEIHANALPGILRPEEGEERHSPSPAQSSLQRTLYTDFEAQERQRERDRYNEYLDELDSSKLPHAFDLGWRRNIMLILGPNRLLWWLPICNSIGDGWNWEPSQRWLDARDRVRRQREEQMHRQLEQERIAGSSYASHGEPVFDMASSQHAESVGRRSPRNHSASPSKADKVLGRTPNQYAESSPWRSDRHLNATPLQSLRPTNSRNSDDYDSSSDEERTDGRSRLLKSGPGEPSANWNDIPQEFLEYNAPSRGGRSGRKGRGR